VREKQSRAAERVCMRDVHLGNIKQAGSELSANWDISMTRKQVAIQPFTDRDRDAVLNSIGDMRV